MEAQVAVPHYLRVSIGHWNIDTHSPEAERIFRQIETDGVAVFRAQPGFVRYRLMRENSTTTIAVAEWESEPLGLAGAESERSGSALTSGGVRLNAPAPSASTL